MPPEDLLPYGQDTYRMTPLLLNDWPDLYDEESTGGDQEFLAYRSEITTGPQTIDPYKDWTMGGSQWQDYE